MASTGTREQEIEYIARRSSVRVQDIPAHERPRELAERVGLEHVPDQVLLALILRSGVRGNSVIQVAGELMRRYGSLLDMARASVAELAALRGVGPVRAQVLKAALEIGQRMVHAGAFQRPSVKTSEQAARVFQSVIRNAEKESVWALLLDSKHRMKQPPVQISVGTLDQSLVHPREVFCEAIRSAASAVIVAHNHPSGDTTPSACDLRVTRQLIETGKIIDIRVLDHIIISSEKQAVEPGYLSLREAGLVEF